MFININKDIIVKNDDIIGIFNLDYIKNTKEYRNLLNNMIEKKEIIKISDIEKTFILIKNDNEIKGYITNVNASTIGKHKNIVY